MVCTNGCRYFGLSRQDGCAICAQSGRSHAVAQEVLHAVAYNDKTTQPYEYYWFAFRKWILILKKILRGNRNERCCR